MELWLAVQSHIPSLAPGGTGCGAGAELLSCAGVGWGQQEGAEPQTEPSTILAFSCFASVSGVQGWLNVGLLEETLFTPEKPCLVL